MNASLPRVHPAFWRLGPACLLLLGLQLVGSSQWLMQPLLSGARATVAWIEPAFAVRGLTVQSRPEGRRVRLEVALARPVTMGDLVVLPHPRGRATAQVPLGQVWQGPLLLLLTLLAWPGASVRAEGRAVGREWLWRALLACPALLVVLTLDTPLVLLGEIWKLLREAHPADDWRPAMAWADLLSSGGRQGFALLLAAAIVAAARKLSCGSPGPFSRAVLRAGDAPLTRQQRSS